MSTSREQLSLELTAKDAKSAKAAKTLEFTGATFTGVNRDGREEREAGKDA